jgi:hypothetical protein
MFSFGVPYVAALAPAQAGAQPRPPALLLFGPAGGLLPPDRRMPRPARADAVKAGPARATRRARPCMGPLKSSVEFAAHSTFFLLFPSLGPFLWFNLADGFLPSQPQFRHAGARRGGQGRPSLEPIHELSRFQARTLTAPSTAADLGDWAGEHSGLCVCRVPKQNDDVEGSPQSGQHSLPQPCIRWAFGPDHDACMRIGGEAPRRRAHS